MAANNSTPRAFTNLGHADHDMPQSVIDWAFTHPDIMRIEPGQFVSVCLDLPVDLASVPSALYGPEAGDSPVADNEVTLEIRGNRKGPSRLIDKPHRPARRVAVIGIRGGWCFTMYGTQASEPSPREPWDASLKEAGEQELKASQEFWASHALAK